MFVSVSSLFFPPGKGILSILSPIMSRFSKQFTCPSQSGGIRRVMLLLVVNVWSLFFAVVVCGCCGPPASAEMSQYMVGAGLPVAEQLNKISLSSSSCPSMVTCVVWTSDIPLWRIETCHFKTTSYSDNKQSLSNHSSSIWLLWMCRSLPCTVMHICSLVDPSGYTLNEQI